MAAHQKTFFLIPGFKENVREKPYQWLAAYLENKGARVVLTPVAWSHKTLSQNANEFIDFFNKNRSEENYVLGFSFGAVITLLTANALLPEKIFLCSLSPAFAEDVKNTDLQFIRYLGKKRFADLMTHSGRGLAKDLEVASVVFYGNDEGAEFPKLVKRCEETASLAKNSKLVVVKDAPHKIDFPGYKISIQRELDLLF